MGGTYIYSPLHLAHLLIRYRLNGKFHDPALNGWANSSTSTPAVAYAFLYRGDAIYEYATYPN